MSPTAEKGLVVTGVAVTRDEAICPVCGQAVDANPRVCQRCETPHHADCWEYTGGCAIFGCVKGEIRKPVAETDTPYYEHSIKRWMTLYRLEGFGKAAAATVLVAIALGAALGSLAGSLHLQAVAGLFAMVAGMAILSVYPILLFFLIINPLMWWYERTITDYVGESGLVKTSPPNRDMIDRLDLPTVDKVSLRIVNGFASVNKMIGYFSIFYFLCTIAGGDPLAAVACIFLAIFAYVVFPTAKNEFEERAATLASIQNRLIASLKGKS